MKFFKTLYYISVSLLSFFAIFFSYAIDTRFLWVVITMYIFLMFFPNIHQKMIERTNVKSNAENPILNELATLPNEFKSKEIQSNSEGEVNLIVNDDLKESENDIEDSVEASKVTVNTEKIEKVDVQNKEYIFMNIRAYSKYGISLSSERFSLKEEADYFAEVFKHNYNPRISVHNAVGGGYIVMADFVKEYLIQSNYQKEYDGYVFANWKYEQRHNLPEPPLEHFVDKYPKIATALVCGIITLPLYGAILLFEKIRGAAPIPSDYSVTKASSKELASMSGIDFERYVAKQLRGRGYKNIKVTQSSGDFGADVLAVNSKGETVCIQCKHYSKPVGIKAVQEIYSAKQYYKCNKAIVVTNSTYTQAATELAKKTNVELWANFR